MTNYLFITKVMTFFCAISLFSCSDQAVFKSESLTALSHSEVVTEASAISKDGRFHLVASEHAVCLWDQTQVESPPHCLKGYQAEYIELVDISENNQFYLTSNHVAVHLYSLVTHQLVGSWQIANDIINDLDISADGNKILLGLRTGQAVIIEVSSNKTTTFAQHRLTINSVSLSDDGNIAFTGSSDKKALLWHTETGENIHEFSHRSRVNHVSISSDGTKGFSLAAIKSRIFWDLTTGEKLAELGTSVRYFQFNDTRFSDDNSLLLTASPKQMIKLWRVMDGELLASWQSKITIGRASVLGVAFVDQDKIATSNSDGLYEQWPLPPIDNKN